MIRKSLFNISPGNVLGKYVSYSKEKHDSIMNYLLENQSEVLYNHSRIYADSYLNLGRLRLFINKDFREDNIIPVVKKFPHTPQYIIWNPKAEISKILETYEGLTPVSNKAIVIMDLTEEFKLNFMESVDKKQWKAIKTSTDVIYDAKIVHDIKGGKFSSIRNTLKKVRMNLNPVIKELSEDTKDDALKVFDDWKKIQGIKYLRATVGRDIRLIETFCDKVDNKDIFSFVHYVEGYPVAVSFGTRSLKHSNWGQEITLKANPNYYGMSDFARQHLVSVLYNSGMDFINDSGLYGPGIKNNKMKWQPCQFINQYDIVKK